MNKALKTVLIVLLVLVVLGGAIAGFFIGRHNKLYISQNEALDIALSHAGLSPSSLRDKDIDFDSYKGSAWYDVDFEVPGTEYEYSIDAVTGEILYSYSEPDRG